LSKTLVNAGASETLEVEIEALDAAGDGVARVGRRTFSVPFTIPGERVRVRPAARARADGIVPASLAEVLRASPHRVTPGCRHFGPDAASRGGPCGGCSWQHIAYAEQLRLKSALVTRLVQGAVKSAPGARPVQPSTPVHDPWRYRHKVHFVFGSTGGARAAVTMGHYARGSRRVVPIDECPVHADDGNALAFALRDACARHGVQAASDPRSRGVLKSVTVRVAQHTGERMVTLVMASDTDPRVRAATRRALAAAGSSTSLHVNLHPRADAFIFGRDTRRIAGPERLRDTLAGTSFLVSPAAFFQTNVDAAERLVALVREAIEPGAPVLDLYAGAGLFALPLALAGHQVVAVEENGVAVADGEASRALNRISSERCRWVRGAVETAWRRLPPFDTVVLDPPRVGCSVPVAQELFGARRPARVIYVSCNPETLARDLGVAARHGYAVASLQPVDMFPHTPHVETVAVLRGEGRGA